MTKPPKKSSARAIAYQDRHRKLGLCIYCPDEAELGDMCKRHRKWHRKYARDKYRRKAGIPLNAKVVRYAD